MPCHAATWSRDCIIYCKLPNTHRPYLVVNISFKNNERSEDKSQTLKINFVYLLNNDFLQYWLLIGFLSSLQNSVNPIDFLFY